MMLPAIRHLDTVARLVFGTDSTNKIGEETKRLGIESDAKISLLVDAGVAKLGLADKVVTSLEAEGLKTEIYSEIEREPTLDTVQASVDFVRSGGFDVVVGIGGGSAMDVAKAAAIMATNPGQVPEYYGGYEDRISRKPLPKILVPTTGGTGSEMSNAAVAINEKAVKTFITSPYALADVAIVDPLMSVSCPPRVTASSGMDALSHALESFLTPRHTQISDAFALHAIRITASSLRTAYYEGEDVQARSNMALAAALGGMGMNMAPNNIGHCIAEAIGPMYKIPHGVTMALVTPYQMEYNLPASLERMALLASYLGEDVHGLAVREAAQEAVRSVSRLVEDLELPTSLKALRIPKSELPRIVSYIVEERQFMYDLTSWNPKKLSTENVTELFDKMWEGSLLKEET